MELVWFTPPHTPLCAPPLLCAPADISPIPGLSPHLSHNSRTFRRTRTVSGDEMMLAAERLGKVSPVHALRPVRRIPIQGMSLSPVVGRTLRATNAGGARGALPMPNTSVRPTGQLRRAV